MEKIKVNSFDFKFNFKKNLGKNSLFQLLEKDVEREF